MGGFIAFTSIAFVGFKEGYLFGRPPTLPLIGLGALGRSLITFSYFGVIGFEVESYVGPFPRMLLAAILVG